MNLEDLKQQENCPLHGKRTPCQSCQDIMNKTYGMETPKEKNYFDTSCQKCGHVPQGERHLCNWETPKENWIEELYKIWNDKTTLIEISEFIAQLLLTQRQERLSRQDLTTPYLVGFKEGKEEACKEILGMIEGMNYKLNVDEYLPLVESWDRKNFDVPFDHGYKQAKADLSHRIEERYKSE